MKILYILGIWIIGQQLSAQNQKAIKINGSTTVNPVVSEAAEHFRQKGWKIFVDTQGGSSGGISYLAEGLCDIGMSSRPISSNDKKKFPNVNFLSHPVGYDGVALVVSKKLYTNGIKSLSKEQIKSAYEGKIKNWSGFGGPNQKIVFFNKEPGRGTWEVFAKYLYGKAKFAPKVFHPEVGANQEARSKVASSPGGITQLSASWAWDNDKVQAISLMDGNELIEASLENIESGKYPMRRPLLLITNGPPDARSDKFLKFLLSPQGQKIVEKHGYLPLSKKDQS